MLIRSYLYIPGNRSDFFPKALQRGADAIVIDLEDAVPERSKPTAAGNCAAFLKSLTGEAQDEIVFVRVNEGSRGLEDIHQVFSPSLSGLRIPKAEDASLIAEADGILSELEDRSGLTAGAMTIMPIIESATGLFALEELVEASRRINRVIFGAGDFCKDIRGLQTPERKESLFAREWLVAQSRRLGLEAPVAHAYSPIPDLDGLQAANLEDRSLGFFGRSCLHPSQIPVVNDGFSPTKQEVEQARRILASYEERSARGMGAFMLDDGTFVDTAVVKRARQILDQAGETENENYTANRPPEASGSMRETS